MCVGSLAGVTYLRYTVLTRSEKTETAVHCCDPVLSGFFSRVGVSKRYSRLFSRSISLAVYYLYTHFILADQISYRSYARDPTFAVFIVCGPL